MKGNNMTLKIISPAFSDHGQIPERFSGEGMDISPPLVFSNVPSAARSLALIVDDPDAPDPAAPKKVFVHWVVFDMPPTTEGLPEGTRNLPEGAKEGTNDFRRTTYGGPMPPIGRHRYFFKLFALDKRLLLSDAPTKAEVEKEMQGHIVAQAVLMGTYELKNK